MDIFRGGNGASQNLLMFLGFVDLCWIQELQFLFFPPFWEIYHGKNWQCITVWSMEYTKLYPKLPGRFVQNQKTISLTNCIHSNTFFYDVGTTECFLLLFMLYAIWWSVSHCSISTVWTRALAMSYTELLVCGKNYNTFIVLLSVIFGGRGETYITFTSLTLWNVNRLHYCY